MYPRADGETPSQIGNTGVLGSRIGSLALAVRDDSGGRLRSAGMTAAFVQFVARMSAATCGEAAPGCRFAHPGYRMLSFDPRLSFASAVQLPRLSSRPSAFWRESRDPCTPVL